MVLLEIGLWESWDQMQHIENAHRMGRDFLQKALVKQAKKSHLDFANGGEGFIAWDRMCFECGESGHWGFVRVERSVLSVRSVTEHYAICRNVGIHPQESRVDWNLTHSQTTLRTPEGSVMAIRPGTRADVL